MLIVVVFHAFPTVPGFVGVDIFFVISGYLITGLVAADIAAGSFTVTNFYAPRPADLCGGAGGARPSG